MYDKSVYSLVRIIEKGDRLEGSCNQRGHFWTVLGVTGPFGFVSVGSGFALAAMFAHK